MKKVAILLVLAVEFAVLGCGNNVPSTVTNTSTTGNWEAQLINATGQASLLNFVVSFNVINSGPLNITGFSFFNQGACFNLAANANRQAGNAQFSTNISTGQVTGTLNLTVTSNTNGNVLTLKSNPNGLTGTSNGTTTTLGSLSNGVVVGTWTLTPDPKVTGCTTQTGTFLMCQGVATCSPPAADRPDPGDQF